MQENFVILAPHILSRIDQTLMENERAKQAQSQEEPTGIDRMSSAGRCWRERWAAFRGLPIDEGKGFAWKPGLLRIFGLGHAIEDEVIRILEEAGFLVTDQQLECVGGDGRWIGHIDGIIWSEDVIPRKSLLEIKSSNVKRFELLKEVGYAAWSPNYAAQVQAYLHTLPEGVEDAIVIVYCKDNSELYAERILYDLDYATKLEKQSALVTAEGDLPPPRPKAARSRSCAYCKWCDRQEWCWSPLTDLDLSA